MTTTLLTYCTPDYQKIYDEHIGPCIKVLGLKPHSHYERKPDNWAAITRLKPGIILEELKKGNPVLYVDSDAEITSKEVMNIDIEGVGSSKSNFGLRRHSQRHLRFCIN